MSGTGGGGTSAHFELCGPGAPQTFGGLGGARCGTPFDMGGGASKVSGKPGIDRPFTQSELESIPRLSVPMLHVFGPKKGQSVTPLKSEGLKSRLQEATNKIVGKKLGAQMMRTLFLTYFDKKGPTMDDRESFWKGLL